MNVVTFLVIVALIAILWYILFGHTKENFVPGKYVITWQAPASNGGDPTCCSYDWQVCSLEDKTCSTPVDSGKVSATTASTSKVSWGDTYNVMVRANNKYGPGSWTSVQLTAGGGVMESVVFGESISTSGQVLVPLSSSSQTVQVWTNTPSGSSISPNTRVATISWSIVRGGSIYFNRSLTMNSSLNGSSDIFMLSYPLLYPISLQDGDVIKAYIYVTEQNGNPFADIQGSVQISGSVPGAVTGLKWTYVPLEGSSVETTPQFFVYPGHLTGQNIIGTSPQPLQQCINMCALDVRCDAAVYNGNPANPECTLKNLSGKSGSYDVLSKNGTPVSINGEFIGFEGKTIPGNDLVGGQTVTDYKKCVDYCEGTGASFAFIEMENDFTSGNNNCWCKGPDNSGDNASYITAFKSQNMHTISGMW